MSEDEGIRQRVTHKGEEALGKFAQELLENPIVTSALSAAFETRERAVRAQEVAMGALNLPSASDLERLTRRLRGVSQRLEGIEDALDRLEQRIEGLGSATTVEQRLAAIEAALGRLEDKSSGRSGSVRARSAPAKRSPGAARSAESKSAPVKRGAARSASSGPSTEDAAPEPSPPDVANS
jgi:TolA-binding protein